MAHIRSVELETERLRAMAEAKGDNGQGIPTAFFFSGRYEDLHAPIDDPEKVDFEKAQRLSQLAYEVIAELGNRDASIRPPAKAPSNGAGDYE
jgi:hypothetical protein